MKFYCVQARNGELLALAGLYVIDDVAHSLELLSLGLRYLAGNLVDYSLSDEEIAKNLAE